MELMEEEALVIQQLESEGRIISLEVELEENLEQTRDEVKKRVSATSSQIDKAYNTETDESEGWEQVAVKRRKKQEKDIVIKYDTGCSRNMSGVKGRLKEDKDPDEMVIVTVFNSTSNIVDKVGKNVDEKKNISYLQCQKI